MAGGAPPSTVAPAVSSAAAPASSGLPPPPPPPKILLAKPASGAASRLGRDEDPSTTVIRSRNASQPGSLTLISDSWDVHIDRILPFLTENSDFTVIGIIGPPGVGKSTIMNELYGFDGSSPGMLPPFATQSDEVRAMSKHCTIGVELRVSSERFILLDAQPIFSSSVLVDMMRPDGLSEISVLNGESLSADLAHELMGIQLGVFLASVCNILLVVSEGIDDFSMWQHMLTCDSLIFEDSDNTIMKKFVFLIAMENEDVKKEESFINNAEKNFVFENTVENEDAKKEESFVDLLKHSIPDPSTLTSGQNQASTCIPDKDIKSNSQVFNDEYLAAPVFIHTKLRYQELSPSNVMLLRKTLLKYLSALSININKSRELKKGQIVSSHSLTYIANEPDSTGADLFCLPLKLQDDSQKPQFGSYNCMLRKLCDEILSMKPHPFAKPVTERDWLRNSSKIWGIVKRSPVIMEYSKTLQDSGLFRK